MLARARPPTELRAVARPAGSRLDRERALHCAARRALRGRVADAAAARDAQATATAGSDVTLVAPSDINFVLPRTAPLERGDEDSGGGSGWG